MEWKFIKGTEYVINIKGEIITRGGKGVPVKSRPNAKGEETVKLTLGDKTRKTLKVDDLIKEYFGEELQLVDIKETKVVNKEDAELKEYDKLQWKLKGYLKEALKIRANRVGKDIDEFLEEIKKEKILVNSLGFCLEPVDPLVFVNSKVASEVLGIDEEVVLGTALGLNKDVGYYYRGLSLVITKGEKFIEAFPNINLEDYLYEGTGEQEAIVESFKKTIIAHAMWSATKDSGKVQLLTTYKDYKEMNSNELRKKYGIYFK